MTTKSKFDDAIEANGRKNWTQKDFLETSSYIKELYDAQSPQEKLDNAVYAIRVGMEFYLEEDISKIKTLGDFVAELLDVYKKFGRITHERIAKHWDLSASNLRKYIKGERSISIDLILKIAATSKTKPQLWLDVQNKNQLLEIQQKNYAEKYSLEKLAILK